MAEIEADSGASRKPGTPARKTVFPHGAITHTDKVLYEKDGITKGDIAEYYWNVAERMIPYVENRIISTVRCPGGIGSACFFKRHPSKEKGVFAVPVSTKNGEIKDYYYVKDIDCLLYTSRCV